MSRQRLEAGPATTQPPLQLDWHIHQLDITQSDPSIHPSWHIPISGYESPIIRKQQVQVFSSQTREMEMKLRVFRFTK